ncbi:MULTISPECIES: hypothetical protein [unclassified Mesorhizobium]|nr:MULTISPECIES: hypothetical protein [unclassified Mesorhizobium]
MLVNFEKAIALSSLVGAKAPELTFKRPFASVGADDKAYYTRGGGFTNLS